MSAYDHSIQNYHFCVPLLCEAFYRHYLSELSLSSPYQVNTEIPVL